MEGDPLGEGVREGNRLGIDSVPDGWRRATMAGALRRNDLFFSPERTVRKTEYLTEIETIRELTFPESEGRNIFKKFLVAEVIRAAAMADDYDFESDFKRLRNLAYLAVGVLQ